MSTQVQLRKGSTAEHASFTGAVGEVTVDVDKKTAVVHDGSTAGGNPLLKENNPSSTGTLTHSGDVNLTGAGKRIRGDFSNATIANRTLFQTSTVNGNTSFGALPNGTSTNSNFSLYNNSDPTNSGRLLLGAGSSTIDVSASIMGTGTYLPLTFYTGGVERLRIDTNGNVGIGAVPVEKFQSETSLASQVAGTFRNSNASPLSDLLQAYATAGSGTGFYLLRMYTAGPTNIFSVRGDGLTTVNTSTGGLGYGTGAGGTVTQATSKSTAVTLNKPCGQITMNNAALAANTGIGFLVNNSLVSGTDTAVVHIQGGTTSTFQYEVSAKSFSAGLFYIYLRNTTAVSLSEAVVINFAIIKGAIA